MPLQIIRQDITKMRVDAIVNTTNKKTAISFAVALELSLDETQNLLSSVGFVLSDSSLFDVIIKYCLENEIYDIFEIDSALFKYDQETLFLKFKNYL